MDYRHLKSLIESFLFEENLKTLNRTYGVEFEMCFDWTVLEKYFEENKASLPSADQYYGRREFLNGSEQIWMDVLEKEGIGDFIIHYDGSINGDFRYGRKDLALEIVTPILTGEQGLYKIMHFLDVTTKKLGGYVNDSCGGHVHIGAADLLQGTEKQVANRFIVGLLTAHKFAPLLRALVPEKRRSSQWARDVEISGIKAGESLASASDERSTRDHVYNLVDLFASDRYKMINFKPLQDKGTIEFRIFDGSLDYRTIEQRVRFGTAFVNLLAATEIDITKNLKTLKDKVAGHLEKGPRTNQVKALLREILLKNVEERRLMIENINAGERYSGNGGRILSNVGSELVRAVAAYPLYTKPVILSEHTIIIEMSSPKNIRLARQILNEFGLTYKIDGTKVLLTPVRNPRAYKQHILEAITSLEGDPFFTDQGITPEEFLNRIDPEEAAPYKVSLEKYQKDIESGIARTPEQLRQDTRR